MHILVAILLMFVNAFFLFLTLLGLPGNWLMILSAVLVGWLWQRGMFSPWTLLVVVALAVLGEVLEFAAGAAATTKAGGSRRGALGAILGGIAGSLAGTFILPIPLIGTLLGACGGACIGAMLMEMRGGRRAEEAARLGVSAGLGTALGRVIKVAVGGVIWLIVTVATFWP